MSRCSGAEPPAKAPRVTIDLCEEADAPPPPAPAPPPPAPQFSAEPLCTICVSELRQSRFLDERRLLPFRDAAGRVNLHLLRASAESVRCGRVTAPAPAVDKLHRWLRHAEAWSKQRQAQPQPQPQAQPQPQPQAPPPVPSRRQLVEALLRDGYVLLRGVVPASECRRFLDQAVAPALRAARISRTDPSTWAAHAEAGGAVLKGAGADFGHPIPLCHEDARWPALFGSPLLNNVLDDLHGGGGNWSWVDGAAEGVGWIHLRMPLREGLAWSPPAADGGWHIDGCTRRLDTEQSVVALPLVTTIRHGGGGTALIPGSHTQLARWMHDQGEAGAGRKLAGQIAAIVKGALRDGTAVEATGSAGDVLLLHPLLVHAPSDANAVGIGSDGSPFRHGLRVTFNLSTNWARPPLSSRAPSSTTASAADSSSSFAAAAASAAAASASSSAAATSSASASASLHPPLSPLEASLLWTISRGIRSAHAPALVRCGEPLELRFTSCHRMLSLEHGLACADHARTPARPQHEVRFERAGAPASESAGTPLRYGDVVVLRCRGADGAWTALRVGPSGRAAGGAAQGGEGGEGGGEGGGDGEGLLTIEGYCELRGVPLRAGADRFYLRAGGGVRRGCVLEVEAEGGGAVGAWTAGGALGELEALKLGALRGWCMPR